MADYKEKYAAVPGVIEANTYDMIKIMTAILEAGRNQGKLSRTC